MGVLTARREEYTTDYVYGISRDVPLNYVSRSKVDERLIENLTRDKHVVIYGSSKQGKTSLRKHCLKENDYITVQCSNRWTLEEILSNILKRAGFSITLSEKRTIAGKNKILASITAGILGLGAKVEGIQEKSEAIETNSRDLELDPSDVNDVIAALQQIRFNRFIVLEDFHYLPPESQKDFAVALKAFHETSKLCFIIVGVWLEENRLVVYNGDLTGRVVAVNADNWTTEELNSVIEKGEALLNIRFAANFKEPLIRESFSSVYIVQEACRQACLRSHITRTQEQLQEIGQTVNVKEVVGDVVNEQSARYNSFLSQFASGFQETRLEM